MDKKLLGSFYNLSFLKTLREGDEDEGGEGKFGLVPLSVDPNSALAQPLGSSELQQSLLKSHPLLSKSSQFSGIDAHLTPNPVSNEEAQDKYPQLKKQFQNTLTQKKRKGAPRLVRK